MDTKSFDTPTNDVEFNFATAAMKGRRYNEAVQKFEALALKNNTPKVWCGMGLAKMGLLMSDSVTVDEVEFCFETARSLDPQNSDSVESLFCDTALRAITELYTVGRLSKSMQDQAKKKMINGALTTVLGGLIGARKEASTYSTIVGVGTSAYGVKTVYDAQEDHAVAQMGEAKALILINELETSVSSFAGKNQKALDSFNSAINAVSKEVRRLEQIDFAANQSTVGKLNDSRKNINETFFYGPLRKFRQKLTGSPKIGDEKK
jgi:hypothetical protein